MKRIAICMDGTWQRLTKEGATNVATIARSVAHSAPRPDGQGKTVQIMIYSRGVGAFNELSKKGGGRLLAGAFGVDLADTLLDTYMRLVFNYEPEDEIYIFGFSRGAFSARSLAGLISRCGIVSRRHADRAVEAFELYRNPKLTVNSPEVVRFREETGKRIRVHAGDKKSYFDTQIRYLGIFDTVGQLGVPGTLGNLFSRKHRFHDLKLSSTVESARHALALDEQRGAFPPTLWENFEALNQRARDLAAQRNETLPEDPYQQRWFPGGHGDVGGGPDAPLAGHALNWIVAGAEARGLVFDREAESKLSIALQGLNSSAPMQPQTGLLSWGGRRARTLPKYILRDGTITEAEVLRLLHPVAIDRMVASYDAKRKKLRYKPAALRRVTPILKKIVLDRLAQAKS